MADNKLHFDHGSSAPLPTEAAADGAVAGRFGAGHAEEKCERKVEVGDRAGIRAAQPGEYEYYKSAYEQVCEQGIVCPPPG